MSNVCAAYTQSSFIEFIGNPLVEALPALPELSELPRKLLVQPKYHPTERYKSDAKRLFALQRISALHIPTRADTDIAINLSRCLIWGYFGRNPMSRSTVEKAILKAGYELTEPEKNYLFGFTAPVYGFPVIGLSGVGKSTSIVNILKQYPQVIVHTAYMGEPFVATQVVWLKVDIPCDGSPKGLCAAIIQELDAVAETQYSAEYISSRTSKDVLLIRVRQLASSFHLGVLVLDEVQNLCTAKKEASRELLNFLVTLANTIRIPIVMVGSPLMTQIFQSSFQQAKRVTGQGEVHMNLMKKEDGIWPIYFRALWSYQYTKKDVPLTDEIRDVFFEESVGNPFICSILYKLVQDDAIISQRESFDAKDIHRVAAEKLGLTSKMRKDMLEGRNVDLAEMERLWNPPVIEEKADTEEPVFQQPLQTVQQKVAVALMQFLDVDVNVANDCAKQAIENNPALTTETALIRQATEIYFSRNAKTELTPQ